MPDGSSVPDIGDGRIEAAVRAMLGRMSGDISLGEAALLAQIADVGREVAWAKTEIAALRVGDINPRHIPGATDELDAVVSHTATATNEILDCCETLEGLRSRLSGADADALSGAVTRIYEACGFQDITGQRIGKVVAALKAIEHRVAAVTAAFGPRGVVPAVMAQATSGTEGERLAQGPQLPATASSQAEIDRLLASLD